MNDKDNYLKINLYISHNKNTKNTKNIVNDMTFSHTEFFNFTNNIEDIRKRLETKEGLYYLIRRDKNNYSLVDKKPLNDEDKLLYLFLRSRQGQSGEGQPNEMNLVFQELAPPAPAYTPPTQRRPLIASLRDRYEGEGPPIKMDLRPFTENDFYPQEPNPNYIRGKLRKKTKKSNRQKRRTKKRKPTKRKPSKKRKPTKRKPSKKRKPTKRRRSKRR